MLLFFLNERGPRDIALATIASIIQVNLIYKNDSCEFYYKKKICIITTKMQVIKRNGELESVQPRIRRPSITDQNRKKTSMKSYQL